MNKQEKCERIIAEELRLDRIQLHLDREIEKLLQQVTIQALQCPYCGAIHKYDIREKPIICIYCKSELEV
ncbi:MAG: hypothetical protein ACFFCI_00990 [Promethearchaeota archaeon]